MAQIIEFIPKIQKVLEETSFVSSEAFLDWLSSGNLVALAQLCAKINLVAGSHAFSTALMLIKVDTSSEINLNGPPSMKALYDAKANAKTVLDILVLTGASLEKGLIFFNGKTLRKDQQHEIMLLETIFSNIVHCSAFWKSEKIFDAKELSSFIGEVIQFHDKFLAVFQSKHCDSTDDGQELDELINFLRHFSPHHLRISIQPLLDGLHLSHVKHRFLHHWKLPHVSHALLSLHSPNAKFHIPHSISRLSQRTALGQILHVLTLENICKVVHSFFAPSRHDINHCKPPTTGTELAQLTHSALNDVQAFCERRFQSQLGVYIQSKIWEIAFFHAHLVGDSAESARRITKIFTENQSSVKALTEEDLNSLNGSSEELSSKIADTCKLFDEIDQAALKVLLSEESDKEEMDERSTNELKIAQDTLRRLKHEITHYTWWWRNLILKFSYAKERITVACMNKIGQEEWIEVNGLLTEYANNVYHIRETCDLFFAVQLASLPNNIGNSTDQTRSSLRKIMAWSAYHTHVDQDIQSQISEKAREYAETIVVSLRSSQKVVTLIVESNPVSAIVNSAAASCAGGVSPLEACLSQVTEEIELVSKILSSMIQALEELASNHRHICIYSDGRVFPEDASINLRSLSLFKFDVSHYGDWWDESEKEIQYLKEELSKASLKVHGAFLVAVPLLLRLKALENRFIEYSKVQATGYDLHSLPSIISNSVVRVLDCQGSI